jgi:PAS domain S-box-containing protein
MDLPTIDASILKELEQRAKEEAISVDELLVRFLNIPSDYQQKLDSLIESERSLRQSEERFKLAANMARLGIWDWEIASDKTEWYGEMFNIYGISPEEFTGRGSDYIDFTRADYRLAQESNIIRAFENGISEAEILAGKELTLFPKELCIVRPDGTEAYTRGDAIAIVDAEGKPLRMLGFTVDISEEKRIEQNLRIKDIAINSSITAIALADMKGRMSYVNQAFLKLWKFDSENEVLGRFAAEFWDSPEEAHAIVKGLRQNQAFRGTLRARLNDGSMATIDMATSIVTDALGQAICIMASFTDVTSELLAEQLRLEQERLKASLKKEQEFNILVQKAVSVLAHDIRTPLTVISNSKQILDRYFDRLDEEMRHEKLDSIGKQLHYVVELLNEMSLTVKGSLDERIFQARPVNLSALCQASINEIQETVGINHQMYCVCDKNIDLVSVDETLISRILLNLLSNAVKFSPEGSEIRLELSHRDNWLIIEVIDQGLGIAAEDIPHIFEPFFRVDKVRHIRGTGLGLNIVKDCVERHQGQIYVESEIGKGSRFTVELPYLLV